MAGPTKVAPPSDDKRWRIVEATMRRNGYRPDGLIETLHSIQSSFGYLDEESLIYVSKALPVSPGKVFGVATFYHYFQLKPAGEYACSVCTGTACYIKGAKALLQAVQEAYGIVEGETTDDNLLSLLTVRCVGACGLAPVAVLNEKILGGLTPEVFISQLQERIEHGTNDKKAG